MLADLADIILTGRVMVEGGTDEICSAVFFTMDHVFVMTEARFEPGDHAVLYLESIGALRGIIDRPRGRGFILQLIQTEERAGRIAARLGWLAEQRCRPIEQRVDPRLVPLHRDVTLRLPDGAVVDGRIENLSKSGALVSLPVRVPLGLPVTVGKRHATVVRIEENAIALRFRLPFCDSTFHPGIVL